MIRAKNLKCKECREEYPTDAGYVCSRCCGPLEVVYPEQQLDATDLKARIAGGPSTLWRYADFLPLTGPPPGSLPAGLTPLISAPRLAERLGVRSVWVKNDAANPTHSFKDRVVSVAISYAKETGATDVGCASTGNLANAVAAASASLGLRHHVLVPANLERAKLIASDVYGDGLLRIRGSYDQINRLSIELADEKSWSFVNLNLRPYYAEGSKTIAYEIMEQLGYRLPTRVVCPIASGSLYTKIARGFREWCEAELVTGDAPIMHGAQPLGCSPVAQAFHDKTSLCQPVKPDTLVSSLAIGNPADGAYALKVADETGGTINAVSDKETWDGICLLAQTTGVFTEAAGGVTIAAALRLAESGQFDGGDEIVICITGSGLKTAETFVGDISSRESEPNLESVLELC